MSVDSSSPVEEMLDQRTQLGWLGWLECDFVSATLHFGNLLRPRLASDKGARQLRAMFLAKAIDDMEPAFTCQIEITEHEIRPASSRLFKSVVQSFRRNNVAPPL